MSRFSFITIFISFLLLFINAKYLFAQEGTKQFMLSSTDIQYYTLPVYTASANDRLFIYLKTGEKMFFGIRKNGGNANVRVKDPNGSIVFPATAIPSLDAGYISTYSEADTGFTNILMDLNGDGKYTTDGTDRLLHATIWHCITILFYTFGSKT